MAGRKRRVAAKKQDDLLSSPRWSQLQHQVELERRNHSEEENCIARRRCREFLEGGWGSVDWVEVYGQK